MVFCETCGQRFGDGANFCGACGRARQAIGTLAGPIANQWGHPGSSPAPAPAPAGLPANVAPKGAAADGQVGLADAGERIAAKILDNVVLVFTLGIGWVIWNYFTSPGGQSPGKKLLRLRVVHQQSGQALRRWEGAGRGAIKALFFFPYVGLVALPIALYQLCSDPLHRTAWDRTADTLVVSDPTGKTVLPAVNAAVPMAAPWPSISSGALKAAGGRAPLRRASRSTTPGAV